MTLKEYNYLLEILKEHEYYLKDELQRNASFLEEVEKKVVTTPWGAKKPAEDLESEKEKTKYRMEIDALNLKLKGLHEMIEKINALEIKN